MSLASPALAQHSPAPVLGQTWESHRGEALGDGSRSKWGPSVSRLLSTRLSAADLLALRAALVPGEAGHDAYRRWAATTDLETLDFGTLRLIPLIAAAAESHGVPADDPVLTKLRGIAKLGWLTSQFEVGHALRDAHVVLDAGIPLLATKGLAVLALSEVDLARRPMDDVDLTVHPADANEALRILATLGYRPVPWIASTPMWQRHGPTWFLEHFHSIDLANDAGIKIDLHWHPMSSRPTEPVTTHLWEGSVSTVVEGLACQAESAPDALVHAIIHAQFDDGVGVRWAADVVILLRAGGEQFDWARLIETAHVCAASAVVADALGVVAGHLGVQVPPEVWRFLATQRRAERLAVAVQPATDFLALHRPALATTLRRPGQGVAILTRHLSGRQSDH